MKSKAKAVLLIGAALVALMLLFPPWNYFDNDTSGRLSAGYHFFLTPPEPRPVEEVFGEPPRFPHMASVLVNDFRLIIQLMIAIPTAVGLAFMFRGQRSRISTILGILFLLCAAFVAGVVVWLVVSEGLEYGVWALP
jgi:hypothetical protein